MHTVYTNDTLCLGSVKKCSLFSTKQHVYSPPCVSTQGVYKCSMSISPSAHEVVVLFALYDVIVSCCASSGDSRTVGLLQSGLSSSLRWHMTRLALSLPILVSASFYEI